MSLPDGTHFEVVMDISFILIWSSNVIDNAPEISKGAWN
jgi:hypothetical protein